MSRIYRQPGLLVLAGTMLLALSNSLSAGRLDPLNNSEINLALTLSQPVTVQARSAVPTPDNTNRREILLTERHQGAKEETARLADVYVYDYDINELEQTVINLDTQKVISRTRSQGVQLPLTAAEISRASDIIMNDDEEFSLIKAEYQRIVGDTLSSIEQLEIKAFTFYGDSLPQKVNAASIQCGVHRCAQLLIYTHDHVVFEISPIVDLSTNVVTQNIGF